jgi:hypothetical protein
MTPLVAPAPRNQSKSHAALGLQPAAPMRSIVACAALTASLMLLAPVARAQSSTTATGTCTGTGFAGIVGLSVPNPNGGALQTVQAASIPYVFGNAECVCPAADANRINLEIKLTTPLPIGTTGTAEVWVGSGCDVYATRTSSTQMQCEKVGTLDIQTFTSASNSIGNIEIPIPGDAINSPVSHSCSSDVTSNNIWVFFYKDPVNPFATCSLTGLNEQNRAPLGAEDVNTGSGDGAVDVRWTVPAQGSYNPSYFQVLCADDCGNAITTKPKQPLYSTCIDGVLHRRQINTGGTLGNGSGSDGGTSNTDGGATLLDNLQPYDAPLVSCTNDGVNDHYPTIDGGTNPGPLADLDPKFVCSGQLGPTTASTRVTGLQNGNRYHFVVVAVDNYGNATASPAVAETPLPTEDLYRRYRDTGGGAAGCFIATAAFGSYESGWVQVLRDFRDETLLAHDWGRGFVRWYYAHSPPAAAWLRQHEWARAITRVALLPFIAGAYIWVHFAAWQKLLLLLALCALLLRKRLIAAARRENVA